METIETMVNEYFQICGKIQNIFWQEMYKLLDKADNHTISIPDDHDLVIKIPRQMSDNEYRDERLTGIELHPSGNIFLKTTDEDAYIEPIYFREVGIPTLVGCLNVAKAVLNK